MKDKTVDYSGVIAATGLDDQQFRHLPMEQRSKLALDLALLQESLGWCSATPSLPEQCEVIWMFGNCIGGILSPPLGPNRKTASQLLRSPFSPPGQDYTVGLEFNGSKMTVVFRLRASNLYCLDMDELFGISAGSCLRYRVDIVNETGEVVATGSHHYGAVQNLRRAKVS